MSALRVAAQPGTVWPKLPGAVMALTLTAGLAIGLAVGGTMAARTGTQSAVTVGPVTPPARTHAAKAPTVAPMASFRQVVSNLKAAESRHDFAAQARFGDQLKTMLTAEMIGKVYQEQARLDLNLEAAMANHEYRAAARASRLLGELCGAQAVKNQLAFCN